MTAEKSLKNRETELNMKNMVTVFDKVMMNVMTTNNKEWYEVFDSELFDTVEKEIADIIGITVDELYDRQDFSKWYDEMYGDL